MPFIVTLIQKLYMKVNDPSFPHSLNAYTTPELEAALEGTGLRTVQRHRIGLLKSPLCPVIVFELEKNTGEST